MPDMPDFLIQIERLTEEPKRLEFDVSGTWWGDRERATQTEMCEVEEPFRFVLSASRVQDEVFIEGAVSGRVGRECSRCVKRYPHPLHDTYRLALSPIKGHESVDPEGKRGLAQNGLCLGEDLEAGLYRGSVVRLDDFFGEVIALAMPIQPLCDDACLGICSHCGENRNGPDEQRSQQSPGTATGCDCKDEKIESPFAVLASLKQDQGGGQGG
ncbi:MAG: hypothetical protein CL933_20180 [Deltaproteobacteria bacterium]|nr:hypothetical protein [Deltaproteobacteria bacterium]